MLNAVVSHNGSSKTLFFDPSNNPLNTLNYFIAEQFHIPSRFQVLKTTNGIEIDSKLLQSTTDFIFVCLSWCLVGGKGGFGSRLRAEGGRMSAQKSTNFGSCRDLSGRRLRAVAQAKLIEDWKKKYPQLEKEKKEKIKKKIEKALEDPTKKIKFTDNQFLKDCDEVAEQVEDAVFEALSHETSESKVEKGKFKGIQCLDDIPDDCLSE